MAVTLELDDGSFLTIDATGGETYLPDILGSTEFAQELGDLYALRLWGTGDPPTDQARPDLALATAIWRDGWGVFVRTDPPNPADFVAGRIY